MCLSEPLLACQAAVRLYQEVQLIMHCRESFCSVWVNHAKTRVIHSALKKDSTILFLKLFWDAHEKLCMPLHCPLQLLNVNLPLLCPWLTPSGISVITTFSKLNLLVSNLATLTLECMRGQQQSKQSLKFVFWSTQRLLAAAIKCKQMHLQSKTRLAVSSEAGLSWLMVCLHLLWTCHASKHAHSKIFNIRANVTGADWLSPAHTILSQRPSKDFNGSFASFIPLALNHVCFTFQSKP